MFSFKADDIYSVAKPFHICSQLIGLTSFSISNKNGIYVASVTLCNIVCIMFSSIWSGTIAYRCITDLDAMWRINTNLISEVFEKSMICVVFAFLITSMISNWWIFAARKNFANILNTLMEVDEEFASMKIHINFRRHKQVIFLFVCCSKVLATFFDLVTFIIGRNTNLFYMSPLFLISVIIFIETNIFTVYQFTFWMWSVKLRYEKINFHLRESFLFENLHNLLDGNEKLNKIAALHDKLVDVTETINSCYGFPVRLNFICCLQILSSSFSLADDIDSKQLCVHHAVHFQCIEAFNSSRSSSASSLH